MPVWERPPVSVANGLCHPWHWITAQAVRADIADNIWAAEVCSAEATELPAWKRPPVSVANRLCHPRALDPGSATPKGTPSARDDTVNSLVVVYFWLGVHHFTNVFPNPYPADPVDPVIRVLYILSTYYTSELILKQVARRY